jgi:hypothetical protein
MTKDPLCRFFLLPLIFDPIFRSFQVEVEVESESRPGKNVQVKVKSEQDSYVGLLGIDQSVLLLKSGNDVTKVCHILPRNLVKIVERFLKPLLHPLQENVIRELESYDSGKSKDDRPFVMFRRRKRFISDSGPSSAAAADVFEVSQLSTYGLNFH